MKKLMLIALAATAFGPLAAHATTPAAGAAQEGPGAAIREWIASAAGHALAFRRETPLTGEQKEKVGEILSAHRGAITAQMRRAGEARRTFADTAKQSGASSPAALQAAERLGVSAKEGALLFAKIAEEVRPLLTPAQQARIDSARGELRALADRLLAGA